MTLGISSIGWALLIVGCSSKPRCIVEPTLFPDYDVPLMGAIRVIDKCEFTVAHYLCVEGAFFVGEGRMVVDHSIFEFSSDGLKGSVPLIDLSLPIGSQYKVEVVSKEDSTNAKYLSVRVDSIFIRNRDSIHQFRIQKSYCYGESIFDQVIFVSQKRGVIGSYVSDVRPEGEYMMITRGDCLSDIIDYSKKIEATLK